MQMHISDGLQYVVVVAVVKKIFFFSPLYALHERKPKICREKNKKLYL